MGVRHDGVWGESGEQQPVYGASLIIRARETTLLGQLVDALLGQLFSGVARSRMVDPSVPAGCVAITAPGEPRIVFVFEQSPHAVEAWALRESGASGVLTVTSTREEFERAVDGLLAGAGFHILPGLLRMGFRG